MHSYDKAIGDLTVAIRLNPRDPLAYGARGVAYIAKKYYDEAVEDCTKDISTDPRLVAAYEVRGKCWFEKLEYVNAIADFDIVLRLGGDNALNYCNRAPAWMHMRNFSKAITDYDEALRLDPACAQASFHRGVVRFLTGAAGSGQDERRFLEIEGFRGQPCLHAVILGHFGFRRSGNTEEAR